MQRIIERFACRQWLAAVFERLLTARHHIVARWGFGSALPNPTARQQLPQYPLTYEQLGARKKEFVDSISRDAVCDLASRDRGGRSCRIFGEANGSFNACFFVEFPDDDTRRVVRVAIDAWAKVQGEVATMR
jgi:hypothetical protein